MREAKKGGKEGGEKHVTRSKKEEDWRRERCQEGDREREDLEMKEGERGRDKGEEKVVKGIEGELG